MDSPKRTAIGCEVQGSPIFKFLCTLSPIKQAKSVHVAQTYSELSFPAPPAVFASPSRKTGRKQCPLPPAKTQNPAAQDSKGSSSVQEEQDKVSKATQFNMRGARRRCLDFDDSQTSHSAVTDDGQDLDPTPTCSDIAMPSIVDAKETETTTTSEAVVADVVTPGVCPGTTTTCTQTQTILTSVSLKNGTASSDSCPASETLRCSREGGGLPAGIGLHLNSLTSSLGLLPRGVSLQSPCAPTDMQSTMADIPATSSALNFRPNLLLSVIEKTRTDEREFGSQDAVIKSTTCVRALTLGIQAIDERVPFDIDKVVTPGRKRLSLLEEPADEPSRTPPKKKRRSSSDKYGDGCKRCHCKKSKCLKLYCECFAAGVYCLDSCACRDCFNKPEFAETVLGTRQQIETRNPLAFAPKIVQTTDCVQVDGASCPDTTTTTSARHKRGCNCKKSLCLKKYCECYQAGVGCSDGCRCNGCKNIYGIKKPEPEETELDDQSVDLIRSSISPVTPFQHTTGVDLPPDSSALGRTIYGTTGRSFGMDSNGLFPSPNIEQQPSPCWEGVDDISAITPLVQHPLRPPPTSSLVKAEPATSACPVRFVSSGTPSSSPISNLSKLMNSENLLSDETPDFTEDPSPPSTLVKGGSPKQKRVLPPNMLLSSSSGGGLLRSGRKLNLSTLPSLPPVTHFSFMHQQQQGGRS